MICAAVYSCVGMATFALQQTLILHYKLTHLSQYSYPASLFWLMIYIELMLLQLTVGGLDVSSIPPLSLLIILLLSKGDLWVTVIMRNMLVLLLLSLCP